MVLEFVHSKLVFRVCDATIHFISRLEILLSVDYDTISNISSNQITIFLYKFFDFYSEIYNTLGMSYAHLQWGNTAYNVPWLI